MNTPFLFDREMLLAALAKLDQALEAREVEHQELIVVGGSYLALADLRQSTRDVDTITRLIASVRAAIDEVGADVGFPPGWLNDRAAGFAPSGLGVEHCSPAFEGLALTVLVPSADWIFLMKLYSARTIDRPDMIKLWPLARFESAAAAVERYWDAYPHAPTDDFLKSFVASIADAAS